MPRRTSIIIPAAAILICAAATIIALYTARPQPVEPPPGSLHPSTHFPAATRPARPASSHGPRTVIAVSPDTRLPITEPAIRPVTVQIPTHISAAPLPAVAAPIPRPTPSPATLALMAELVPPAGVKIANCTPLDLADPHPPGWSRLPAAFAVGHPLIYSDFPAPSDGVLNFSVTQDGYVFLACNFDTAGPLDTQWLLERWTADDFVDRGWKLLTPQDLGGSFITAAGKEQTVFVRYVKRGQSYRIRCNKVDPPYIVLNPGISPPPDGPQAAATRTLP